MQVSGNMNNNGKLARLAFTEMMDHSGGIPVHIWNVIGFINLNLPSQVYFTTMGLYQ